MVDWLVNFMNNAEVMGQLLTAQRVIQMEKEEGLDYTKDEDTMNMLRSNYRINAKRILEAEKPS